jgi:hypothetical protein
MVAGSTYELYGYRRVDTNPVHGLSGTFPEHSGDVRPLKSAQHPDWPEMFPAIGSILTKRH